MVAKNTKLSRWKQACSCLSNQYVNCRCGAAKATGLLCGLCGSDLVPRWVSGNQPFWGCYQFPFTRCKFTLTMEGDDVATLLASINMNSSTECCSTSTPENRNHQPKDSPQEHQVNTTSPSFTQGFSVVRIPVVTQTQTPGVDSKTPSTRETTTSLRDSQQLRCAPVAPPNPATLGETTCASVPQVTPIRPQATATQGGTAPSTSRRRLFTSILLKETFIGETNAANLVQQNNFPNDLALDSSYQDSFRDVDIEQRLHYFEGSQLSAAGQGVRFCYWHSRSKSEVGQTNKRKWLDRKPEAMDLFAGAGGMSHGLAMAGFRVTVVVEADKAAADTLRCNHTHTKVYQQDIHEFLEAVESKKQGYPTSIDHLHASPPCQGFTEAKKTTMTPSLHDTELNKLTLQTIEAVRLLRPSTFSMENVKGIMSARNRSYVQKVVTELLGMDYQVVLTVLNAKYFGVPQHRERVILLAARKGFPLPRDPASFLSSKPEHIRTVQQTLGDLDLIPPVSSGIPVTCRGGVVVYDHIEWKPPLFGQEPDRLQGDQPAKTLLRRKAIRHYTQKRDITIRERARLQSFPDNFYFCGTPDQQASQIGNAVPVHLATAIGHSIMESYNKYYV